MVVLKKAYSECTAKLPVVKAHAKVSFKPRSFLLLNVANSCDHLEPFVKPTCQNLLHLHRILNTWIPIEMTRFR